MGRADFDGDDVPEIERNDVGGDEVDVALGVDGASFAGGVGGASFAGSGAERARALDLNAEEMDFELRTVVEDEVVALAVSPGLADGEAALAGLIAGALGVGRSGSGPALRQRWFWIASPEWVAGIFLVVGCICERSCGIFASCIRSST